MDFVWVILYADRRIRLRHFFF